MGIKATATKTADEIAHLSMLEQFHTIWQQITDENGNPYEYTLEDTEFTPPDRRDPPIDTNWARFVIRPNTSNQRSLSGRRFERRGNLGIQVFVTISIGIGEMSRITSLLKRGLEAKRLSNGVRFFGVEQQNLGVSNGYLQTNLVVEYLWLENK